MLRLRDLIARLTARPSANPQRDPDRPHVPLILREAANGRTEKQLVHYLHSHMHAATLQPDVMAQIRAAYYTYGQSHERNPTALLVTPDIALQCFDDAEFSQRISGTRPDRYRGQPCLSIPFAFKQDLTTPHMFPVEITMKIMFDPPGGQIVFVHI